MMRRLQVFIRNLAVGPRQGAHIRLRSGLVISAVELLESLHVEFSPWLTGLQEFQIGRRSL